MKNITLNISGMNCPICAANITHNLKKHRAIKSADVKFATATAAIKYDNRGIDIKQIKKIVGHTGFRVINKNEAANHELVHIIHSALELNK